MLIIAPCTAFLFSIAFFRPLFQTSTSQWRALSGEAPVSPSAAYSYIKRSLQQTAPQIIGALRLLSQSFAPSELNKRGYALYVDFRPEVGGWGKKGEVRCEKILSLRTKGPPKDEPFQEDMNSQKKEEGASTASTDEIVKIERTDQDQDKMKDQRDDHNFRDEEPDRKKVKGMSLEEYEAALDADDAFVLPTDTLDSLP